MCAGIDKRNFPNKLNVIPFSVSLNLLSEYSIVYIAVPPDRISIKDDSSIERSTVVGPYVEGDIVTLSCEVFGGKFEQSFYQIEFFNHLNSGMKSNPPN